MFKFNNDHIITGHIKQLLADFNLPKYRVYTKEQREYFKAFNEEKNIIGTVKKVNNKKTEYFPAAMYYNLYIKDGKVQYCEVEYEDSTNIVNNKRPRQVAWNWGTVSNSYSYGQKIINGTRNLRITGNIYDTYTHEYLGDYLRFKRDYLGIDLMPLYNCFSNKICNALNYNFTIHSYDINNSGEQISCTHKIIFDASNTNYKIYMFPVKLFKNYTIAIDSGLPVEICCGLYGKYSYDRNEKLKNLPIQTYRKYSSLNFNSPVLYTKLNDIWNLIDQQYGAELGQNEQDLKMFIKLPANNDSSIVVLEGDYRSFNDGMLLHDTTGKPDNNTTATISRVQNTAITNFNQDDYYNYGKLKKYQDFEDFSPVSALQLLRANTKVSYPFADRLVEYLLDNVITSEEENIDNIKRTQKVILNNNKYTHDIETIKTEYKPLDQSNYFYCSFCKVGQDESGTKYIGYYYKASNEYKQIVKGSEVFPGSTIYVQITKTPVIKTETKPGVLDSKLAPKLYGNWDASIRPIVYEQFNSDVQMNRNDSNHDILGYIDKEIEACYSAPTGKCDEKENEITNTISNIDLYTDNEGKYNSGGNN